MKSMGKFLVISKTSCEEYIGLIFALRLLFFDRRQAPEIWKEVKFSKEIKREWRAVIGKPRPIVSNLGYYIDLRLPHIGVNQTLLCGSSLIHEISMSCGEK